MSTTASTLITPPPEASASHPQHHAWIARVANTLLDTSVLIITGGHVQLNTNISMDPNPIENGNIIDVKA